MQIPTQNKRTIILNRFNALNFKKNILIPFCYKNALEVT